MLYKLRYFKKFQLINLTFFFISLVIFNSFLSFSNNQSFEIIYLINFSCSLCKFKDWKALTGFFRLLLKEEIS